MLVEEASHPDLTFDFSESSGSSRARILLQGEALQVYRFMAAVQSILSEL